MLSRNDFNLYRIYLYRNDFASKRPNSITKVSIPYWHFAHQPPRLFVSTLCARFPLSFISPSWEPQRDWKRSSFAQKLSPWVVAAKCNDTQTKMITSANGVNDNVSRIINTQSYCHAQESLPKQRTIIGNVPNLLGTIKEILTLWEIFVWKVGSQLLQLFPWFEQKEKQETPISLLLVSTLRARFRWSFISPSWEPQRDWKWSSFTQKLSPWVIAAKCSDTQLQTKMITSANGVNDNVSPIINTQSYCHTQENLRKQRTIIGNVLNLFETLMERQKNSYRLGNIRLNGGQPTVTVVSLIWAIRETRNTNIIITRYSSR